MTPQTFIFIGRSGCGKGTQAKLLDEYLKKLNPEMIVYHIETGDGFRNFTNQDGYTSSLAKNVMLSGARQPDFLAVWMWSHLFIEQFKGTEHIIIDGTPRSLNEARVLDGALTFYNRVKPFVIYLDVSREWSENHLKARGRADDDGAGIKHRLDWYERDVQPAIEYYRDDPNYNFLDIDAEQPIDAVFKELIEKAGLLG